MLNSSTEKFKKGMRVRYRPNHVDKDDDSHPDIQKGCVSSINDRWVFVKYDNLSCKMFTGDEPFTAAATCPQDLEIIGD
jgi:hypothetical protein